MKKIILILVLIFIILGCSHHAPINITNKVQYERDSNWCLNYNSPGRTPVHTETYKQCMERIGYKYQ
jgi:uncharacterized protein YxeA